MKINCKKATSYPKYLLLTLDSEHDLQAIRHPIITFENRNLYTDKTNINFDLQTNVTAFLRPIKKKY